MSSVSITPRGLALGRFVKALAIARGDPMSAHAFAMGQAWRDTPSVEAALKALVAPATVGEDRAAPTLASPIALDLAELVRPSTILGRLTGLRRVPNNVRLIDTTAGTSGHWVGEGHPISMGALSFDDAALKKTRT